MKRLYLLLPALLLGSVLVGCHSHHGYHHDPHYTGYHHYGHTTYVSHAPYCNVCHGYHHGPCH